MSKAATIKEPEDFITDELRKSFERRNTLEFILKQMEDGKHASEKAIVTGICVEGNCDGVICGLNWPGSDRPASVCENCYREYVLLNRSIDEEIRNIESEE